jgi:dipeptidase E
MEFIEINPGITVVGLREGTMFKFEDSSLQLIGNRSVRIFRKGIPAREMNVGDDFSFLLDG